MGTLPHSVMLDLSGLPCPAPLLGAKRVIDELKEGQTLLLISDCPGTSDDLFAWVRYTDNQLTATEKREGGKTGYFIRKGKAAAFPTANAVLDIRGVSCPGPIVEAKKLLDAMQSGEVLLMISNCPGAPADVRAWTKSTSLELAATRETSPGVHEFYIQKK